MENQLIDLNDPNVEPAIDPNAEPIDPFDPTNINDAEAQLEPLPEGFDPAAYGFVTEDQHLQVVNERDTLNTRIRDTQAQYHEGQQQLSELKGRVDQIQQNGVNQQQPPQQSTSQQLLSTLDLLGATTDPAQSQVLNQRYMALRTKLQQEEMMTSMGITPQAVQNMNQSNQPNAEMDALKQQIQGLTNLVTIQMSPGAQGVDVNQLNNFVNTHQIDHNDMVTLFRAKNGLPPVQVNPAQPGQRRMVTKPNTGQRVPVGGSQKVGLPPTNPGKNYSVKGMSDKQIMALQAKRTGNQ